ncbi:hypothetical protein ONZ45_g4699 [Pleurotus djamor]|nr:hypothetical protein ONZ45_g4699 [Pleurotus djamor]
MRSPPQIPNELVLYIISFLMEPIEFDSWISRETLKPPFAVMRSCSQASKTLRGFALAAWFRVLVLRDPSDVRFGLQVFPQIGNQWTREIYCMFVDKSTVHELSEFKRATTLNLDFMNKPIMWMSSLSSIAANIKELNLLGHSWLSPMNLCLYASQLPELSALRIQVKRLWCHLCNLCTKVHFAGLVPEKIVYQSGLGLPIHYANALVKCTQLRHVSIGVEYTADGSTTIGHSGDAQRDNPNFWVGECDSCMNLMYKVDAFRQKWVASKKSLEYTRPPALETVEWELYPIVETSSTASHVSTSDFDDSDRETASSTEV